MSLLSSTAEQNYQTVSVVPEVNAVSGTEIDLVFHHSATNCFDIRVVALRKPRNANCNFSCCLCIQIVEPICIGTTTTWIQVFKNRDPMQW
ncbi:MAG: hypothetical protein WA618_18980 [Terriglobales bacterium]